MWSSVVELFQAAIFATAHVCGGSLGAGIVVVSAAMRIAMLPLTLRMARQANAQAALLASLEPELKKLQHRHGQDAVRLAQATQALYKSNGISAFSPAMWIGIAVQAPPASALFAAVRKGLGAGVRFLWVRDLARPDLTLLSIVCALMAAGVAASPAANTNPAVRIFSYCAMFGVMLVVMWSTSSAVVLSFGAGSLVSLLQNRMLARESKR
jgi:YidC/Oxa1 family membrane protein insertase